MLFTKTTTLFTKTATLFTKTTTLFMKTAPCHEKCKCELSNQGRGYTGGRPSGGRWNIAIHGKPSVPTNPETGVPGLQKWLCSDPDKGLPQKSRLNQFKKTASSRRQYALLFSHEFRLFLLDLIELSPSEM